MENLILSLDIESVLSVISIAVTLLIACVGGIYAITTNTKKYELTESYRKELLRWYATVVDLMIGIIHYIQSDEFFSYQFSSQRTRMLSQLSALTEVGRFYFPNVIKNDDFGSEKPSAYQGYRHIALEFLLYFYEVSKESTDAHSISLLRKLERHFTSAIFDIIDPRTRSRDYSKYLMLTMPKGQSIEDYIEEKPANVNIFRNE